MTKVYLVRHGETEWNSKGKYLGLTDIPLNNNGERQAKALSSFLSKERIDAVYSSALTRTIQTARIIAEPHGLNVCKVPGLNEIDFGEWDGLTYFEIKDKYSNLADDWLNKTSEVQIPGGETWDDFKTRVLSGLRKILNENENKNILIVSHGGPIKTIISDILGLELTSFWKITQDRGALNIVKFFDEGATITLLNDTYY
ncbi:alpha-ribazole phosphatase [Candidatus Oleimmundimicrobium sp.]|uniref:alpha-ribazole phosphatase n=1 Tax=Candidatus Oleimmundimicrobium sp. TaxID=3060597 RepID=UPI002728E747|nr:alpha-ribazole phosphatase [Candidatus Oleimmundimicrobium sp.]MDO8885296.1 alpha-ribazole phosphatase [Candidatus Oleimmundimicrobium sp.]